MNPIFNQWVAEYSVSQKAFHIHTVKDMCERNLFNVMMGKESDYLPIGMFETHQSAHNYVQTIKSKIILEKSLVYT
jgi:hypothetical protein